MLVVVPNSELSEVTHGHIGSRDENVNAVKQNLAFFSIQAIK